MTPEEQAAADAKAKEDAAAKAKADADAKQAEEDAAAAEAARKAEDGEGGEGEGADKDPNKTKDELDLDKELDEERKRGADPEKAKAAFQEREARRKAQEEADKANADADKPLTRKDMREIEERAFRRLQTDNAQAAAKAIATSDKEAQLIFLKWQNRSFPDNMPLQDQIEEAYAITHRKKIIGERTEALRALRNKGNVKTDASGTQRDAPAGAEPKLSAADRNAIVAAGFEWDGAKRLYKKILPKSAGVLYRDPKSGRVWRSAK